MFTFEDITTRYGNYLVPALIIILVIVLFVLIVVTLRFRLHLRNIRRQEMMQREVAYRRRIRLSDKEEVFERDNYTCQICGISRDFLDSLCSGLGDYLLLEADHIQSVSQGGTGKDIDNLQCLCWRCNRKKGGKKTNEEVKRMIDYGIEKLDSGEWN
ncbi:HNH endonuclease [Ruminococcaceae bacterium YAD3003]|nr:HNH endonuclease [Ruminococcaceae bacterium YAD3003]